MHAGDRCHHAGGGLVVGPGVDVDAAGWLRFAARADIRFDHGWGLEPGGARGCRELAAELAEDQVLCALLDEAERCGIPERGGPAVAENDLVAVGNAEQFAEAGLHARDQVLDRRLAVGGADDRGTCSREVGQLLGAHLGRAAAETSVGGQQVTGNCQLRHTAILGARHGRVDRGRSLRSFTACAEPKSLVRSAFKVKRYY